MNPIFEMTTHAHQRAVQRAKLEVTPEHMEELTLTVKNETYIAKRLDKHGKNHIILTRLGGRLVTVCVDLTTQVVVSFLPTQLRRWPELQRGLTDKRKSDTMLIIRAYCDGIIDKVRF